MDCKEIIKKLEALENPMNVEGMARFGIRPKTRVLGISIPELRKLAKALGKNHELALKLWDSKIHEARILAGLAAEHEKLTEKQIIKWAKDFDSWDVVDQVCMNLFDKSEVAKKLILKFAESKEEFVKRTAFSLMAALASHDKKMADKDFIKYFPIIKKASTDERNFVRKAVNWALRGIGKRNLSLNKEAIKFAKGMQKMSAKPAKWIALDAIRELTSDKVQKRL
jgi:3-methyladenine DNA glycosylase AlkD